MSDLERHRHGFDARDPSEWRITVRIVQGTSSWSPLHLEGLVRVRIVLRGYEVSFLFLVSVLSFSARSVIVGRNFKQIIGHRLLLDTDQRLLAAD